MRWMLPSDHEIPCTQEVFKIFELLFAGIAISWISFWLELQKISNRFIYENLHISSAHEIPTERRARASS